MYLSSHCHHHWPYCYSLWIKFLPARWPSYFALVSIESREKWGQKPSQPLPWYVSVSKSSIFRSLFSRLIKLSTVVYISWCRSVSFYVDHLNQQRQKQQSWRQSPQPRGVGAVWKYIFSRILLHTTPVYWVWVAVYSCPYFEASFSLISHRSPESRISVCLSERKSKARDNFHNHVELVMSGNINFSVASAVFNW